MSTTTTRVTAAVAAGLLTVGLPTAPATALRLVPVDPPGTTVVEEPNEDPSLLLTMGRLAAHTNTSAVPAFDPFMSMGRLPR